MDATLIIFSANDGTNSLTPVIVDNNFSGFLPPGSYHFPHCNSLQVPGNYFDSQNFSRVQISASSIASSYSFPPPLIDSFFSGFGLGLSFLAIFFLISLANIIRRGGVLQ